MKLLSLILALALSACAATPQAPAARRPSTVRVAACQILVEGDRAAGFAAIDAALQSAAQLGADIAVFPETCLYGWVNPAAHELADPIPGAASDELAKLARKHNMMIVVGLAEKHAGQLYDSAILIDSTGEILLKHRKLNVLSEWMDPPYTRGPDALNSVVDTRHGRIGLLICADTFHKEAVAQLATSKPDLVLVPYGWAAPEEHWPGHGQSLHAWIANTARKVNAPVVGVDAIGSVLAGPMQGQIYGGQSAASGRDGLLLGVLADRKPDVRVFEFER